MTGGRAPKRKGDAFERDVVAFLGPHGFSSAERAYGAGRPDDRADIAGIAGFTIECKAHRTLDLAGFMDEATAKAAGTPGHVPVVVAKRRQRPVGDAYVVMKLADWAGLVSRTPRSELSP